MIKDFDLCSKRQFFQILNKATKYILLWDKSFNFCTEYQARSLEDTVDSKENHWNLVINFVNLFKNISNFCLTCAIQSFYVKKKISFILIMKIHPNLLNVIIFWYHNILFRTYKLVHVLLYNISVHYFGMIAR